MTIWFWIIIGGIVAIAIKLLIILLVVRAHRQRLHSGVETLIGAIAMTKTALNPKGIVYFQGEEWTAETIDNETIGPNEKVRIEGFEGVRLKVKKLNSLKRR